MSRFHPASILFGLALLAGGCGRTGTVTVRFGDARNAGGAVRSALGGDLPALDIAGLRLVSASLELDHDANGGPIGAAAFIWVNPACADDTSSGACDLAGSGAPHQVTDFFDFTSPAAATAALGAQARAIEAGDYQYVSLMFCAGAPVEPNVSFQFRGGVERAFALPQCAVTTRVAEPVHVGVGDSVDLTLLYDPADWIAAGDGPRCDDSESIQPRPPGDELRGWCIDQIRFVPNAALR